MKARTEIAIPDQPDRLDVGGVLGCDRRPPRAEVDSFLAHLAKAAGRCRERPRPLPGYEAGRSGTAEAQGAAQPVTPCDEHDAAQVADVPDPGDMVVLTDGGTEVAALVPAAWARALRAISQDPGGIVAELEALRYRLGVGAPASCCDPRHHAQHVEIGAAGLPPFTPEMRRRLAEIIRH